MALIVSLDNTALDGNNYPQAYVRIPQITADSQDTWLSVAFYPDEDNRFGESAAVVKTMIVPVKTHKLVGSVYQAAYTYLKTMPEFAGAVDSQIDVPIEPDPPPPEPIVYPWDTIGQA